MIYLGTLITFKTCYDKEKKEGIVISRDDYHPDINDDQYEVLVLNENECSKDWVKFSEIKTIVSSNIATIKGFKNK